MCNCLSKILYLSHKNSCTKNIIGNSCDNCLFFNSLKLPLSVSLVRLFISLSATMPITSCTNNYIQGRSKEMTINRMSSLLHTFSFNNEAKCQVSVRNQRGRWKEINTLLTYDLYYQCIISIIFIIHKLLKHNF